MPKQRRHRGNSSVDPATNNVTVTVDDPYDPERWPEAYRPQPLPFDMSQYPGADDRHVPFYGKVRFHPDTDSQIYTRPLMQVEDEGVMLFGQLARGGGD